MENIEKSALRTVDGLFTVFSVMIVIVAVAAYAMMPMLMHWLFPGLSDKEALIAMARILLLSPLLLGISNFLASITQYHGRFVLYGVAPILYNVGIVVGIMVLYPIMGITGLAWGVALGAFLHLSLQLPWVTSHGFMPRLVALTKKEWRPVFDALGTSLPRTLALSMSQIASLFLIAIASRMQEGSIAIFNLSFNLQSVPLAIIGASYSVAAFPMLAKLYAAGDTKEFTNRVAMAAKHIIFWSLPIIALFIVLRAHIVRVVLGASDLFTWSDTRLTAAAVAIFIASLVPQCLNLLFIRAFYAQGKTLIPFLLNTFATAFIVLFSWVATIAGPQANEAWVIAVKHFLRIDALPGGILLLVIAYSVGMTISLLLHWAVYWYMEGGFGKVFWKSAIEALCAAVVVGAVTYGGLHYVERIAIVDLSTTIGIFLQGFIAGIAGIVVGSSLLLLIGNAEIREGIQSLMLRIPLLRKGKQAAADQILHAKDVVVDSSE